MNGIMWGVLLHVGISVILPQLKNANLSNLFNFNVAAQPEAEAPAPAEDTTAPAEEEPLEDDTGAEDDTMGIDDTFEEEPTDGEEEDPMAGGAFGTSGWSRDRFGGGAGSTSGGGRRGMLALRVRIGGL